MHKTLLLLLCFLKESVSASRCYPDYCRNTTNFIPESQEQCLLETVQRGTECMGIRFENLGHIPPSGEPLAQVSLNAYVKNFGGLKGKATAFNFSISKVDFNRLTTRYQSLGNEEISGCRRTEFYGNITNTPLKEFFISCPLFNNSYENNPFRLEYLISANNYEYSRKLVFIVPNHRFIDNNVKDITLYTPFIYIDVSDASSLTLYIQALPKEFNVSEYKIWMINNGTMSTKEIILKNLEKNELLHYNFSVTDGVFYFKVTALHSICHEIYGCVNSTSPYVSIKQISHRLLIMIISTIWIPPVILYSLYHAYKVYKKKEMLRRVEKKTKCLLVYSPSHIAHVNVMIDLARYLRCCNINAMIDTLDIPDSTNKDPILWCNEAFHSADVIIVAGSPKTDEIAAVVYRNMDSLALRLLKENYPRRNKRYYSLHFPYCKLEDIPREAQHFKRFSMPEDLDKLVKTIHQVEYIRFFGVTDKYFVDSIKLAKIQIIQSQSSGTTEENDDLLLADIQEKSKNLKILQLPKEEKTNDDIPINKNISQQFRTNIEELNLLGENSEVDHMFTYNSPNTNMEFRIDTLNL